MATTIRCWKIISYLWAQPLLNQSLPNTFVSRLFLLGCVHILISHWELLERLPALREFQAENKLHSKWQLVCAWNSTRKHQKTENHQNEWWLWLNLIVSFRFSFDILNFENEMRLQSATEIKLQPLVFITENMKAFHIEYWLIAFTLYLTSASCIVYVGNMSLIQTSLFSISVVRIAWAKLIFFLDLRNALYTFVRHFSDPSSRASSEHVRETSSWASNACRDLSSWKSTGVQLMARLILWYPFSVPISLFWEHCSEGCIKEIVESTWKNSRTVHPRAQHGCQSILQLQPMIPACLQCSLRCRERWW